MVNLLTNKRVSSIVNMLRHRKPVISPKFQHKPSSAPYQLLTMVDEGRTFRTLQEAADEIGVSRERIRQIARQYDLTIGKRMTKRVISTWPCYQCGETVTYDSKYRATFFKVKNPALCKNCRTGTGKFCQSGHIKKSKTGSCRECTNSRARTPVGVRYCQTCKQPVVITDGIARQIKATGRVPKYCLNCYWNRGRGMKSNTCRKGHLLHTTEKGIKYCKECAKTRYHRDPKMIPVESSNINSIGYNPSSRRFLVEFSSGSVYEYQRVPKEIYKTMLAINAAGESVGQYFSTMVRDVYKFKRIK